MSPTDALFEPLRQALRSLWPEEELERVAIQTVPHMLLLTLPNDVAAFSVLNSHPNEEFEETYTSFKRLYRENNREWDARTLSFVICRWSEHAEDDRFYASLEHDPLFCRKYVIRAYGDVSSQRDELLRLPFLPLRAREVDGLERPRSAQDFLQSAGLSASFSRKLVEVGHRSAERIALDLLQGNERLPEGLTQPPTGRMALSKPRAHSRLVSLEVEGFRAYKGTQHFDLDASVVVLYGPNGLGKTSVFDAIDYAATGRIGRLCNRRRRTQTEFSEIATHLDKTPGSGSVVMTVRGGEPDSSGASWKVQRGTGNWSTAWLNGEEVDRKAVINRLTQASWPDMTPRQQTLESLFRATHLFGQDEQELLAEFQKGSVIPEAFISEMLALQDYAQGLSKVTEVVGQIKDQRSAIGADLAKLRDESNTLMASLPQLSPAESDAGEATPLEGIIADLRKQSAEAGPTDHTPPGSLNLAAFSEWHELIVARSVAANEQLLLAQRTRNELSAYRQQVDESAVERTKLQQIEKELEVVGSEERKIAERVDQNTKALGEAEVVRKQREQRRHDLRFVLENLAERRELVKQIISLQAERDRQVLERTEADSRLSVMESSISKALADTAEAGRTIAAARSELAELQSLSDDFPRFIADLAIYADAQARITKAREDLQTAQGREAQATKSFHDIKASREALTPEYERALAEQAELERLLDSIQVHVHSDSCPLCGSEFDSVEALIAAIRRQRVSTLEERDVTLRYKELMASEAQASDALRVAGTDVSTAKASIDELNRVRNTTEQRLTSFRTRLAAAHIEHSDADALPPALLQRREEIQRRNETLETNARTSTQTLKGLQTAQTEETAKRRIVHDRIMTLERRIKELSDRRSELDVRVSQILPHSTDVESDLRREMEQVDRSTDEITAVIEQLQISRRNELDAAEAQKARKRETLAKRDEVLASLEEKSQSLADFRQRLRRLELPDNVDRKTLDHTVKQTEQLVKLIHGLIEQGGIIVAALKAREARLQLSEKRAQLDRLKTNIDKFDDQVRRLDQAVSVCESIERLLKRERQTAIERHIAAYGPMITMIQQRLRSVYGFGGVHLEPRGGEAMVQVEWRSKSVHVPPTDFFSDSQRQILMLSIFLAGGLRQNWSGFAPMLLDDPVTHFDDLNAYAFVELVRGIISTSPNAWQFIISTCEERLFTLMQKKFSRLPSGAIFYEFVGMSEKGPIIEQR